MAGVTKMTVSRFCARRKSGGRHRRTHCAGHAGAERHRCRYRTGRQKTAHRRTDPSFNNQIFADLLAGIESVTQARGYQTLVVNYDYSPQREEEQIAQLLSYPIAGLILTDSAHTLRTETYLGAAKIPSRR